MLRLQPGIRGRCVGMKQLSNGALAIGHLRHLTGGGASEGKFQWQESEQRQTGTTRKQS